MAKSSGQKLKILYLMKILLEQTDETHLLTVNELISKLSNYGISAERKTIYSDIDSLRQFGLDIIMERSNSCGYFVASRDFELPELKLLIDAVVSSKFITEKKSLELIKKLENLVSQYDASKLRRQVHVISRVKSMNDSIYYNVDALHDAIADDKKVKFVYFDYNIEKKRVYRKDGAFYTVSPASLLWDDENYYLIAHSDDREGLTHYRVDRMSKIKKQNEPRVEIVKNFNPAPYSKKVFGMFSGEEEIVKLRMENSLIGVVIDRFGKDVSMAKDGENHFTVTVPVALSSVFYGWIFQFGERCEVLSPQSLLGELKIHCEKFSSQL